MESYTWISINDSRILDFYIRHSRDLYFSLTGPTRPFYILFLRHSHAASSYLRGAYLQGPLEEKVGVEESGSICCWAEIFAMFCVRSLYA